MKADTTVPAFFLASATPVPAPIEARVDAREVSDATGLRTVTRTQHT
jgi:hypothetical protein